MNNSINLFPQLKQRTDFRGIVFDRNGELLERFFNPALNTIFTPNEDDRSIAWCHKTEAVTKGDLARSLGNERQCSPQTKHPAHPDKTCLDSPIDTV